MNVIVLTPKNVKVLAIRGKSKAGKRIRHFDNLHLLWISAADVVDKNIFLRCVGNGLAVRSVDPIESARQDKKALPIWTYSRGNCLSRYKIR
jgi:hypothetical protein